MEENVKEIIKPTFFENYIYDTRRTWNSQSSLTNQQHALLGISSEIGELCDAYKKVIGYNKDLDQKNVYEEIGDVSYFTARLIDELFILQNEDANRAILKIILEDIEKILSTSEVPDNMDVYSLVLSLPVHYHNIYIGISNNKTPDFLQGLASLIGNLNVLSMKLGKSYKSLLTANTEKLKIRFPDKFTDEDVTNRDTEAEMKAIDG